MTDASQIGGTEYQPRHGVPGTAPATRGLRWLNEWQVLNGGVTIANDESLSPWRFIPAGLDQITRELSDELAGQLIEELDTIPGLVASVRAVQQSKINLIFNRALDALGKAPE